MIFLAVYLFEYVFEWFFFLDTVFEWIKSVYKVLQKFGLIYLVEFFLYKNICIENLLGILFY